MSLNKKEILSYPWTDSYPESVQWDASIPLEPLYKLIDDAAANYPKHTFLRFMGAKFTYRDIARRINHIAKGLQEIGVTKGARVGLMLPNCPQYVIFYFAVLKIGATVVNYNPLYAIGELKHQVEDSDTNYLVTLDLHDFYYKASSLLNSTPIEKLIVTSVQDFLPFPKNILFPIKNKERISAVMTGRKIVSMDKLMENDGNYTPATVDPLNDIAVLQYTGGTTGTPKGAMLTHANLYANTVQSALWFPCFREGEERMLGALPFFHVFAMTAVMNVGIYKGAEIILHPRFEIHSILRDIHSLKPTLMPGVPTMFAAIANHPDIKRFKLSSLRMCLSGGAPLPHEIKVAFEGITGCTLVEGYGMTEAGPVIGVNPPVVREMEKKVSEAPVPSETSIPNGVPELGSAGLPIPGTVVTIRDIEDNTRILPANSIGEICVAGPQIMKGYYNNPVETEATLRNGVLHTGDLGYIDEKGYIYIIDRLKDVIIAGGFKIYPRKVEEAIYLCSEVQEVAVVGKPDMYRGQTAVAFIKLRLGEELTAEQLDTILRKKLAAFEVPTEFIFQDELPKTLIGKISKKELKKFFN